MDDKINVDIEDIQEFTFSVRQIKIYSNATTATKIRRYPSFQNNIIRDHLKHQIRNILPPNISIYQNNASTDSFYLVNSVNRSARPIRSIQISKLNDIENNKDILFKVKFEDIPDSQFALQDLIVQMIVKACYRILELRDIGSFLKTSRENRAGELGSNALVTALIVQNLDRCREIQMITGIHTFPQVNGQAIPGRGMQLQDVFIQLQRGLDDPRVPF